MPRMSAESVIAFGVMPLVESIYEAAAKAGVIMSFEDINDTLDEMFVFMGTQILALGYLNATADLATVDPESALDEMIAQAKARVPNSSDG